MSDGSDVTRPEFHVGLLPSRPVTEVAALAEHAEELGFDGVWIADSQSIFRDAYAALTLSADRTSTLQLATGVTNPVTRHPAVIAGAVATLAEQAGGRTILGIGVGDSAVRTIGSTPATLARLEQYVTVLRGLLQEGRASYEGEELRLGWSPPGAPIHLASSGPRSLRLAGRVADGVLFQVGASPALVRYALETIEAGAGEAARERPPRRLIRLACVVADDRDEARREARGYVAAAAGTVYEAVPAEHIPDEVLDDLRRMKEDYDYQAHAAADAAHTRLITDRILDAVAIAGTPGEAVPRLRALADAGVDGFVIPVTSSEPRGTMRTLAERVMPHL